MFPEFFTFLTHKASYMNATPRKYADAGTCRFCASSLILQKKTAAGRLFLCVDSSAGQILLDHQRYLEGDGVIKLPQIQAGQLFDLL